MTELIVVAIIAAAPPLLAVVVAMWRIIARLDDNKERLGQIHVLANSRLTEALEKVERLERLLGAYEGSLAHERLAEALKKIERLEAGTSTELGKDA